ncbi:MAG: FKBP-type peptidyl-prolyl cis-trans isomerase [Pseudomonadota bacterium]
MKTYALPLALASAVALQACNQQSAPAPAATTETAEPAAVQLETREQRLSYGIAYTLGQRMAADSVPMDVDAFTEGLRDSLTGAEPKLSQEQIQSEMQAYQEEAMAEQQAAQAAVAVTNQEAATAYLAENATREGVTVTDTGLQYEVVEAGDGPLPGPDDTVEVHYRGTLLDGTEFDSSYNRGETVTFGVSQVIPGWTEALQLMPVGSTYKLTIPPELGYGAGGAGGVIGPNAALLFDVELIAIPSQAEAPAGDAEPAE